ncbi:antigen 5 like allergen Cul n 1 [Stomoxys calcitrans]|uniref:antigen 5 like allergen Cul n 1 n=1 Tax=Stomoxys calcitrans TaxID=35570 RepID=UPI0027E27867|nr:antigen 5 like allergen Cul n 1 [Stomoxys calcitrans]
MKQIFAFLGLICMLGLAKSTDYCDPKLCSEGTHIACGHSGEFAASCPANAEIFNITEPFKDFLLKYHNEKRNYIAGGNDPNHDAACHMGTMQWDDELAALAHYNVLQCKMEHDDCHDTLDYHASGQNLAERWYTGAPNMDKLFQQSVDMWYNEVQYSNRDYIKSYKRNKEHAIGHFTVMMYQNNVRMGCAAAKYGDENPKNKQYFLLACNYANTNWVGWPIYNSCSEPATACTTGTNPDYPNLCSLEEYYDFNA